jgi:hypothetical protein
MLLTLRMKLARLFGQPSRRRTRFTRLGLEELGPRITRDPQLGWPGSDDAGQ